MKRDRYIDRANAILAMRYLPADLVDFIDNQTNIHVYKNDTGYYLRGEIKADRLTFKELKALLIAVAEESIPYE